VNDRTRLERQTVPAIGRYARLNAPSFSQFLDFAYEFCLLIGNQPGIEPILNDGPRPTIEQYTASRELDQ
jgi:hypothetical protein